MAKWGPPIKAELDAITQHHVWDLVPRQKGMNVIPLKWIFTIKENGSSKARLVAVWSKDKEVYTSMDTASPTPSPTTIRWIFALAVKFLWPIKQLDVGNAFLHSNIDRLKYVSLPPGTAGDLKNFVCKLNKALYGLATAPKCWNTTFHSVMESMHYMRNARDPCVYSLKRNALVILLLVYVDDILITGNYPAGINTLCDTLKSRFTVRDLGTPSQFLGIHLMWQDNNSALLLHQSKYITSILKLFGYQDSPFPRLLDPRQKPK